MIKKFFELTSDLMLSLVLLGIITTAAVSVITLSPLTAEDYGYDAPQEQVLGENNIDDEDQTYVITNRNELEIRDIVEEHSFFSSNSENNRGYVQNIKFGPVSAGEIRKEVFSVTNNTNSDSSFLVNMDVPEEFRTYGSFGLRFSDNDFMMLTPDGQNTNYLDGSIVAGSSMDFELIVDLNENVNFPIEIQIRVDEITK